MILRSLITLASVTTLAFGLSGCSSTPLASTGEQTGTQSAQSLAGDTNSAQSEPRLTIVKTPESIDGSQVTLPIKRDLVFDLGDAKAQGWKVNFSESIAEFNAEEPSIHPLATGETTVELTGPEGQTSTFTLIVTPGAR